MEVLLYVYFYNISLNILRLTFFKIIFLFHTPRILGALGSKLGQKLTIFPTL